MKIRTRSVSSFRAIMIFLIISTPSGILPGCHSSVISKKNETAKTAENVKIPDSSQDYALFIPKGEQPKQGWPLLVAIDPHGSGNTALNHLKDAATTYPAIVVASNQIQNNDPHYEEELDALIAGLKKRYPVGNRVYLVGFSGGARMALAYAPTHPVAGVIACGAFTGPEQLKAIHCPVIGLIGMDDFNFSEAAPYLLDPSDLPANVHIELTDASHEWPESNRLTSAWGWFQQSNKTRAGRTQIERYAKAQHQRIDSLVAAGELLQAICISRKMGSVQVFGQAASFQQQTSLLINSTAYKQYLTELSKSMQFEMTMRQQLAQSLFEKNKNWWAKEIESLHQKAATEPNTLKRMAYKRLTGFLGIICYSYSRQLAAQKDIPHLNQILMIYRLAEPENPDMQHFCEVLNSLKH